MREEVELRAGCLVACLSSKRTIHANVFVSSAVRVVRKRWREYLRDMKSRESESEPLRSRLYAGGDVSPEEFLEPRRGDEMHVVIPAPGLEESLWELVARDERAPLCLFWTCLLSGGLPRGKISRAFARIPMRIGGMRVADFMAWMYELWWASNEPRAVHGMSLKILRECNDVLLRNIPKAKRRAKKGEGSSVVGRSRADIAREVPRVDGEPREFRVELEIPSTARASEPEPPPSP